MPAGVGYDLAGAFRDPGGIPAEAMPHAGVPSDAMAPGDVSGVLQQLRSGGMGAEQLLQLLALLAGLGQAPGGARGPAAGGPPQEVMQSFMGG